MKLSFARIVLSLVIPVSVLAACTDGGLPFSPSETPDSGPDAEVPASDADVSAPDAEVPRPDAGDDGSDADSGTRQTFGFAGRFARRAMPLAQGAWAVLTEKPKALSDPTELDPDRMLAWVEPDGVVQGFALAPAGRALLDAVVHPSGEITVLHASADGFFLGRYGRDRKPVAYAPIVDPAIATDPPAMNPGESKSPIEEHTHDVGRIAADGEDVVLATRTGRHSVVAYRVGWDVARSSFAIASRSLVVPAHPIAATALIGGSYDTFNQLDAHYGVHVARGTSGIAWVAVGHARLETGAMAKAHKAVFGETLPTDPDSLDMFVTRLSKDGVRLGTSVVSTENDDQLFGLRAIGDEAWAVGRTERWNAQGTGFDAVVAKIDTQGAVTVRTLNVDRGDIAFDVGPAPDGGLVLVGASGYVQNPHGASISEESTAFARWLRADGTVSVIDLPNGPRHNEARFIISLGERSWIGGMHDGPGTHSADGLPALLRADGFVVQR